MSTPTTSSDLDLLYTDVKSNCSASEQNDLHIEEFKKMIDAYKAGTFDADNSLNIKGKIESYYALIKRAYEGRSEEKDASALWAEIGGDTEYAALVLNINSFVASSSSSSTSTSTSTSSSTVVHTAESSDNAFPSNVGSTTEGGTYVNADKETDDTSDDALKIDLDAAGKTTVGSDGKTTTYERQKNADGTYVVDIDVVGENVELDLTSIVKATKIQSETDMMAKIQADLAKLEANMNAMKGRGTLDDVKGVICAMRAMQKDFEEFQDLSASVDELAALKTILLEYRKIYVDFETVVKQNFSVNIEVLLENYSSALADVTLITGDILSFQSRLTDTIKINISENIGTFKSQIDTGNTLMERLAHILGFMTGDESSEGMEEYKINDAYKKQLKQVEEAYGTFNELTKGNGTNIFDAQIKSIQESTKITKLRRETLAAKLNAFRAKVHAIATADVCGNPALPVASSPAH